MPDRLDSDNRLLRQIAESTQIAAAAAGGVSPAVQQAINNAISALTPSHQRSVTLDNAQILTLPTSPVVLVPETETLNFSGTFTRLPIISRGVMHWEVWEGTPYGNINVPNIAIFQGNDALGVGPVSYTNPASPFFNLTEVGRLYPFSMSAVCFNSAIPVMDQWSQKDSSHDNGLYLGIQFNGGNLTGGHATNLLRVSLVYQVYNLLTGEFE